MNYLDSPLTSAPFMLEVVVLVSFMYDAGSRRYSSKKRVFDKHCMTEFIKQVFPIFRSPLRPSCLTDDEFPYDLGGVPSSRCLSTVLARCARSKVDIDGDPFEVFVDILVLA